MLDALAVGMLRHVSLLMLIFCDFIFRRLFTLSPPRLRRYAAAMPRCR